MTTSADHTHWGIAAYVFSLDLAADLAALAVPGCPWDNLRSAARTAILENRTAVKAGHTPLLLRDVMAKSLGESGSDGNPRREASQRFFDWVQTQFISVGRPRNGDSSLLVPLRDPALLARVDAALDYPSAEAESYAAILHNAIDAEASEILLEAVFEADARIDRQVMSEWDRTLIARNAEFHAPENPLSPLIHSLSQGLLMAAADRIPNIIGQHRTDLLCNLCPPEDMI